MRIKFPSDILSYFLHFVLKRKLNFSLISLTCVTSAIATSLWPYVTGKLVDAVNDLSIASDTSLQGLNTAILCAFVFWVAVEAITRLHGLLMSCLYPRFETDIRMGMFRHVLGHSHAYYIKNFVGSIGNRLAELPKSSSIIVDFVFNNLIPLLIAIIISCNLFLQIDYRLSIILFVWLLIHLLICGFGGAKAARLSKEHSEIRTELQGEMTDIFVNHLNVKLNNTEDFELSNMGLIQNKEQQKNLKTLYYLERVKIYLSIVALISVVILMYQTLNFFKAGLISIGAVVFILTTIFNIINLAWATAVEMNYFFREMGVVSQSLILAQEHQGAVESKNITDLKITKGKIEFNKVSFKYEHNDNVFKDKSLCLEGGSKTALVGFSGSGKTTFVHLILRLFDVSAGKILIDGQNIKKVTLKSLRKNISFIPQEPILLNRSILDNICYGREDATLEEVYEAARKAHCHEFIMDLDEKYETKVGQMGANISGGQKQRIAIARIILKDAPILIMDEATSALDAFTEKGIQKSMQTIFENKTAIVIAHRFSTLQKMNRILVFNNGTIVEDGTHDELLKLDKHYAMLWKMQKAGFLPDV